MIFNIIIGHMGNKIQILLDIDDFFSILFKKTKELKLFFFEKNCPLKMGSTNFTDPNFCPTERE
jgi:hypothetical protein